MMNDEWKKGRLVGLPIHHSSQLGWQVELPPSISVYSSFVPPANARAGRSGIARRLLKT